jgi:hypothetical protein
MHKTAAGILITDVRKKGGIRHVSKTLIPDMLKEILTFGKWSERHILKVI